MLWKKKMPSEPGWYWKRNPYDKEDEPYVVRVRDYAGRLAIGNTCIEGWDKLLRCEWAGPIPFPGSIRPNVSKEDGFRSQPGVNTDEDMVRVVLDMPKHSWRRLKRLLSPDMGKRQEGSVSAGSTPEVMPGSGGSNPSPLSKAEQKLGKPNIARGLVQNVKTYTESGSGLGRRTGAVLGEISTIGE